MSDNCILEMSNVTKKFHGVTALDDVSFKVYESKVTALVGENGAGKTTLMKILSGAILKDSGTIKINNYEVQIKNPVDSIGAGVSMIYQELNLVQEMTVFENVFLGREQLVKGFVDTKKQINETKGLLDSLNVNIDPKAKINNLSVAKQQIVEIVKALSLDAKIVVMDESTSSLTDNEIENLFSVIAKLKENGVGVIYISHKLDEVYRISDYITVLRDGKKVGDWPVTHIDLQNLIKQMIGRKISTLFPKEVFEIKEPLLKVSSLEKCGQFEDINFEVKKGEIVGFFGLVGAGRSEVAYAIFGRNLFDKGEIILNGKLLKIKKPLDAIRLGIGLVPEDRKQLGLNMEASIIQNIIVTCADDHSRYGFMNRKSERSICTKLVDLLNIKTPSINQLVKNLSGGNQQKVVLAKWIARKVDLLILDEPTRGIDVGAKVEVHKLMVELTRQGVGIILISSELPEIMGMSDRIIVMSEGRITGEFKLHEATQEKIMQYAVGAHYSTRKGIVV